MTVTHKLQSAVKDSRLQEVQLPLIQQGDHLLIDARLLHSQLKVGRDYSTWLKVRIEEFGFEAGRDFFSTPNRSPKLGNKGGGHNRIETHLTLDMAKELAMVERNEIGRAIRRYFIQKEKEARGISHLPREAGLFKGVTLRRIFGQQLVLYKEFLGKIGMSTRSSTSQRRARYSTHFVDVDGRLYITQDFATHLYKQKQVMNNRKTLQEAKSGIPANFGTQPLPLFSEKGGEK